MLRSWSLWWTLQRQLGWKVGETFCINFMSQLAYWHQTTEVKAIKSALRSDHIQHYTGEFLFLFLRLPFWIPAWMSCPSSLHWRRKNLEQQLRRRRAATVWESIEESSQEAPAKLPLLKIAKGEHNLLELLDDCTAYCRQVAYNYSLPEARRHVQNWHDILDDEP